MNILIRYLYIQLINNLATLILIISLFNIVITIIYFVSFRQLQGSCNKKERELFISASASEPDCLSNDLPGISKTSRKITYINLNESNDSSKNLIL